MSDYLRGRGGRFQYGSKTATATQWVGRLERDETNTPRYEDNGFSRRLLGNRSCEVQVEFVWPKDDDLLQQLADLANLEASDDDEERGWSISNVELYPDYERRTNLFIKMDEATINNLTIVSNTTEAVRLKGTIKNQGFFQWKGAA